MAFEHPQAPPALDIPQPHGAVMRGRQRAVAVGAPRELADCVAVVLLEDTKATSTLDVPQADVARCREDAALIRAPQHAIPAPAARPGHRSWGRPCSPNPQGWPCWPRLSKAEWWSAARHQPREAAARISTTWGHASSHRPLLRVLQLRPHPPDASVTAATEAGVTDHSWSVEQIIRLLGFTSLADQALAAASG